MVTPGNTQVRVLISIRILAAGAVQFGLMVLNGFTVIAALRDAMLASLLMLIFAQILYLIQHNFHPVKPFNFINNAIIIVFVALFHLSFSGLYRLFFNYEDWLHFVKPYLAVRAIMALFFLEVISLVWWIRKNAETQEKVQQQLLEKERALTKAELDNIHQQLQPHFLFNSLNSIGALTILEPKEAHRMIQLLSNFLRGTLRKDVQQLVPLSEELEQIRLYLEIEKVRFGHRLSTKISTSDTCEEMKVPALILQPILENAIKYGLYGQTNEITISVDVLCRGKLLTIAVSSPYDETFVNATQGKGFGLASIERRLSLFFGQNGLLTTTKTPELFTTTICIPQL